ncbi:hypothetical protein B0E46_14680 [Rhodanobacter sp. B04]|uniref:hypothetical protein n=1 Tax=Rhodanobacter sp. B04 TaxID=1945860 RepID=UPI0009D003DB|nr:hypothetical protein [Rhodanobacter sp. B04]OOG61244.1 hypothetical protein B0E46_14680 [Rhodanobacter sp. B04]
MAAFDMEVKRAGPETHQRVAAAADRQAKQRAINAMASSHASVRMMTSREDRRASAMAAS